jgi:signal transduction histidine kinase
MAVTAGFRFWLTVTFHRAEPHPDHFPRWGLRYIVATTLTGLGWGASVWLFPTLEEAGTLGLLHVLMLAAVTTGAARLLLPMRKGSIAYLIAVMLPLATRFFAFADIPGFMVGLGVIVFTGYMASSILRSHRMLSDALVMRLERESLADRLQTQNTQLELRDVELREARERAESAARAKADFLATISHEIRTPMNGVLGMLRIVRETSLSPEQRDYLKTASDSAETLLLLLNDVLDFSKIEAGRLELQSAPFAPAVVAQAVADLMHTRARDKGLQFELQMGDTLPSAIVGDVNRLRQILVNLIGNAIKFTERGRVELRLTCAERTDTDATLHFTVTDTGIGIDSAALERLFKPFTQADRSLGRRYGGTGLGLAISVRLARAMGGELQVKSTLNQGTTFRLILPARLPDAVTPAQMDDSRYVTPTLRGRVLVVEDDSVNRQVIELFLKKMRVAPKFAHDGEAAIRLAAAETFDVILMDCQLPGIDGMETTRRIRKKLEGGRPLKIIALTANSSRTIRDACLAAGMDDFLTKPVRLEFLVDVLQRNLPKS